MLTTTLNEPVNLQVLAADGRTDLYVRARIYKSDSTLLITLFPLHVGDGLYSVSWTPSVLGHYTVLYRLYTDAGRTQEAPYDFEGETIDVTDVRLSLARLLGLIHENSVFDQQTYNINGRLTGGRLRSYDTKANAVSAGATGLRETWTIEAVYDITQKLTSYKILLEP